MLSYYRALWLALALLHLIVSVRLNHCAVPRDVGLVFSKPIGPSQRISDQLASLVFIWKESRCILTEIWLEFPSPTEQQSYGVGESHSCVIIFCRSTKEYSCSSFPNNNKRQEVKKKKKNNTEEACLPCYVCNIFDSHTVTLCEKMTIQISQNIAFMVMINWCYLKRKFPFMFHRKIY